ncbi:MAG TPA: peptide chain release factor N(5)-glutamine methyltransferase, partial [bacterium]|nr:peptide chain release factor N(5)-glutamine methyltransferase [bacterium]
MAGLTLGEALQKSANFFDQRGCESPRLSAELLLAHVLQTDRLHLYMEYSRPLTERETDAYREMVRRRGQGEPVAYLLGRKEFFSLDFEVDSSVLIPRPETEVLVQVALEVLNIRES